MFFLFLQAVGYTLSWICYESKESYINDNLDLINNKLIKLSQIKIKLGSSARSQKLSSLPRTLIGNHFVILGTFSNQVLCACLVLRWVTFYTVLSTAKSHLLWFSGSKSPKHYQLQ